MLDVETEQLIREIAASQRKQKHLRDQISKAVIIGTSFAVMQDELKEEAHTLALLLDKLVEQVK